MTEPGLPNDWRPPARTPFEKAWDDHPDRHFRLLDLAESERRLRWLAAERGRITTEQPAWLHKPRTRADF
jgi:hypothetical protein